MTRYGLVMVPGYLAPYTLLGEPNDPTIWNNALIARGFSIRTLLTGPTATRTRIISSIQAFVASLVPGDSAAIVFCGHGSTLADQNWDEADGRDECIVSSDILGIRDDEIGAMLALVPTSVKCDVVLDCCYAGTGTRAAKRPQTETPMIDVSIAPKIFSGKLKGPNEKKTAKILPITNHRLWAACAENQYASSARSGGLWYSLFSLYLTWLLRNRPTTNATALMAEARTYVMAAVPSQIPQIEGIALDQIPF